MRHRAVASFSALLAVIAVVGLATHGVAGQAPATSKPAPAAPGVPGGQGAKKWTAPRTPDGQPDLQGYWTNSTYVPLERPDKVTKAFYTEQEFAAAVKAAAERETEQTEPGTVADVHYDFTQFGLDRSQSAFVKNDLRTAMIVDPPNGKMPPLTPEGQKRAADRAAERRRLGPTTDAVQNMPVGTRCLIMAGSGPPMMNAGYNSNYQIVQGQGYVMILVEMIHDARIIPIDTRAPLPENMRQWMGDSRGHWEGDTLVIETANLNGKNPFRGSGERMHVTERLTRVDANTLRYRFTIDDPSTWTAPWTAEAPMTKSVGPIFEHACHEGNYGVRNTLAGARREEKEAAEAAAKKSSN
jgi:hypothetical protein